MFRKITSSALAAVALAIVPAAAAQARVHCHPQGSRTLAADSYARVYGHQGSAYACVMRTGFTRELKGADPATDQFAVGGRWVGFSSSPPANDPNFSGPPNSVLTVMRIPDGFVNQQWYPFQTNETIDKIVVIPDGAAAWAITPNPADGSYTIVQGTDRQNHPADQFSDDHTDMNGSSLHLMSGKTVAWTYDDGTTGTSTLY
jgi:hypothetical protein